MTLGGIIRSRRLAIGMLQVELAARVGVTMSYISIIENNKTKRPPSFEVLASIAEALGLEQSSLIEAAGKFNSDELHNLVQRVPLAGVFIQELIKRNPSENLIKRLMNML